MSYLKKLFKLSKTITLLNFTIMNFRHKLKGKLDINTFVLFSFILSIIGMVYFFYFKFIKNIYISLTVLYDFDVFISIALHAVKTVITVICVFLGLNLFCFSKDIETIRALPIKLSEIFLSKYILVVKYCYAAEAILLAPILIIQMENVQSLQVVLTYITAAIILPHVIVLPIIIIITFSIKLSMILNRSTTVICILGYLVYFAFIGMKMFSSVNSFDIEASQSEILNSFFSQIKPFPFFHNFVTIDIWMQLVCGCGISFLSMLICYMTSSTILRENICIIKKNHKHGKGEAVYHSIPKYWSFFLKEFRVFFRSPVYVLNGLFAVVVAPFLLPLLFQIGTNVKNIVQIKGLIALPEYWFYAILSAIGVIVIPSAINVISASSFSREGANYWIIKIIPYDLVHQAFVKATFGILVSFTGALFNALIFKFYFGYSLSQIGVIFVISLLFCILWNLIGVLIDMANPKLSWINEFEAIKQNVNILIGSLTCITLLAGYFFLTNLMIENEFTPKTVILILSSSLVVLSLLVCKGITFISKSKYNLSKAKQM